jgi:hypothetical protein
MLRDRNGVQTGRMNNAAEMEDASIMRTFTLETRWV